MDERGPRWLIWAVLAIVLGAAFVARVAYDVNRSEDPRSGEWVSLEPDSFYHMRRAERVLREGWPVAGTDPMLDFPDGAEIPWPPYYSGLLALLTGLAVGDVDAPGAHLRIEQWVASVPMFFGCLSALLAALAAKRLGGNSAAACAGLGVALALGSVIYSGLGNGDHHAFVAFLHLALLYGLSRVLASDALQWPKRAAALGFGLGLILGLGLGSWVAFMAYVVEVEVVLAILLFRHARDPLPGLPVFGLMFHLAALLSLMPAVLQSPWQAVEPWSVINLSHFHPFFLMLGLLVFVPLCRQASAPWQRFYPWIVGGTLAAIFSILFALDAGPGIGLREAFSWASREDRFMASILESSSILDDFGAGFEQLMMSVGPAIVLLPPIAIAAAIGSWRGKLELLPWAVAVPLLLLQTLAQLRFSEALVAPMFVLVGWALAAVLRTLRRKLRVGPLLPTGLALLVGLALVWPGLSQMRLYYPASLRVAEPTELQQQLGSTRRMCEWLREQPVAPGAAGVLASWGDGHMIEWVAGRPTVATNFGSYLGAASYRFGPKVFLSDDEEKLEALLRERQVGHLLLNSSLPDRLPDLIQRADPNLRQVYLAGLKNGWKGGIRPAWFGTAMARLLIAGVHTEMQLPLIASKPIGFLRLVHVSPELDPQPPLSGLVTRSPRGWVWQYVAGARLAFKGEPEATFGVRFQLRYPNTDIRLSYEASGTLDANGVGTLRVPYDTVGKNGDGQVMPGAIYWVGTVRSTLTIPSQAAESGMGVDLP